VLNIDDERLDGLARRLDANQKVMRVSGTDENADVSVLESGDGLELRLGGKTAGVVVLAPGPRRRFGRTRPARSPWRSSSASSPRWC